MSDPMAQRPDLAELRFALAEGDAQDPPSALRARVLEAARQLRTPGRSTASVDRLSGLETFAATAARLDGLLGGLTASEWSRPALRDLDVQGLVGHLIGVEKQFADALVAPGVPSRGDSAAQAGRADPGVEHVRTTDPVAAAQAGRAPQETSREWRAVVRRTTQLAGLAEPTAETAFYGVVLPLDALLVVRAFEMWTHEEDIRRATRRVLPDLDAGCLGRMTELAVELLPAGLARAGRTVGAHTVRLVLTGAGGGTFDLAESVVKAADTRIVLDATEFCRVVGNRSVQPPATVTGDGELAADVFAGARALALD